MNEKREMTVVNPNAGGVDVGSERHFVAVPPGRDAEGQDVREFSAFTDGLREVNRPGFPEISAFEAGGHRQLIR